MRRHVPLITNPSIDLPNPRHIHLQPLVGFGQVDILGPGREGRPVFQPLLRVPKHGIVEIQVAVPGALDLAYLDVGPSPQEGMGLEDIFKDLAVGEVVVLGPRPAVAAGVDDVCGEVPGGGGEARIGVRGFKG